MWPILLNRAAWSQCRFSSTVLFVMDWTNNEYLLWCPGSHWMPNWQVLFYSAVWDCTDNQWVSPMVHRKPFKGKVTGSPQKCSFGLLCTVIKSVIVAFWWQHDRFSSTVLFGMDWTTNEYLVRYIRGPFQGPSDRFSSTELLGNVQTTDEYLLWYTWSPSRQVFYHHRLQVLLHFGSICQKKNHYTPSCSNSIVH